MEEAQAAKPTTEQEPNQTASEPEAKAKAGSEGEAAPKAEAKPAVPYRTFETQEDYDKAVKSEASKQKLEWMKQAGVSSVEDYKAKQSAAEKAIAEHDALVKERSELSERAVLAELNVSDSRKADLLTLAKAKVTDQKDLKAAAMEVLENNPAWANERAQPIKIGSDKANAAPTQDQDPLSERYPWLR